ncbi:hypothetical protein F183_A21800 [Bryobacterales bacterium F-183]|nr:hypothetical protein F183_A21800 [Bryobacterales bacterium F-183]
MKRFDLFASAAVALAFFATPDTAMAQPTMVRGNFSVLWDSCGGEDQPACTPASPAYRVLRTPGVAAKCDFTLDAVLEGATWICRDKGRRQSVPDQASSQTKYPIAYNTFVQQADQYNRISADLPLNYVPIIGTHNSYSNVHDGGNNALNVDQMLTITDQLQMGARHIRLDPVARNDNDTPILCHISPTSEGTKKLLAAFNLPSEPRDFCALSVDGKPLSYQRPFFYAVRELKKWLQKHPGEVVILRMNIIPFAAVNKGDLADVIEHELGDMLVKDPKNGTIPTLRQIRSMKKQVLVMTSGNYSGGSDYVFVPALNPYWTNSTSNPMYPYCMSSMAHPVGLPRQMKEGGLAIWPEVGEDRSVSMIFESAENRGMLGIAETETAVYCGYTLIGFDFFHSMQYGSKGPLPFGGQYDFSGPSPDPRPQAAIWSWNASETLRDQRPAVLAKPAQQLPNLPLYLTDYRTYRWQSSDETQAFPFACAGPASADNPRAYEWRITPTAAGFSSGETECQKLGTHFHFWRPMSSIENQRLIDVLKREASVNKVWLNHYTGRTTASPSVVNLTQPAGGSSCASIVMSSGLGGVYRFWFVPSGNSPQFLTVTSSDSSPIVTVATVPTLGERLPPGVYSGTLNIEERAGDQINKTTVLVTLRVN